MARRIPAGAGPVRPAGDDSLASLAIIGGRSDADGGCRLRKREEVHSSMPDLEQWPTGRLLTTAARLVEHAWNERLVDIGVTHAGVIALGALADQGAMTQASLAQIVR